MLTSLEEFKAVEMEIGNITNGIDSPNLLSADSTTAITTTPDGVIDAQVKEEKEEAKEVKEEKKKPEKEEEKTEKEETKPTVEPTKPVEKRIGELTKKWRSAERTAAYEKAKRLEVEEELKKVQAKIPLEGRPLKEDFEDEEDFISAVVAWEVANALKTSQGSVEKVQQEEHERGSLEAVYSEVDDLIETGTEKYSDFEKLVRDESLALSTEMLEVVLDCEESVDVLYFLGKNPDEAARIHELTPARMVKAIVGIENQLKTEAAAKAKEEEDRIAAEKDAETKKKKITNTPEPITPPRVDGIVEKDPNKMTPAEYRIWRSKGKR